MPRSGLCDTAIAVSCFEVYKTSKLHSTRSVLPRQSMLSMQWKVPERERIYSFRLYEKNGEYTRGLRTSGLRERFKSPVDTVLWIG